jgi:SulP family sulfate permease
VIPPGKYNAHISGVLKDSLIIALFFISICFIDVGAAAFVSVITAAILLIRRTIFDFNPELLKQPHIRDNEKELTVPKGVDVFDLSNVPSMEYLYKYIEVIPEMLVIPEVIIIRLKAITSINEYELGILDKVILRLQRNKITVILSDVETNVQEQITASGIEKIIRRENIFLGIDDAFLRAERLITMGRK